MKYVNTCSFILDVEDGRTIAPGGSIEIEGDLSAHDQLLLDRGVLTQAPSEEPTPEEPEEAVDNREASRRGGKN